jgi:hypothetical protein
VSGLKGRHTWYMKKAKKRQDGGSNPMGGPPPQLLCGISNKLMRDPWTDAHGNNFDGPTIHEWIDQYGVNPITGEMMTRNDISPNPSLRALLSSYRPTGRIYQDKDSPKKKLMKLMKYSVKAVQSIAVPRNEAGNNKDDDPDFDAIVRFRAQQFDKNILAFADKTQSISLASQSDTKSNFYSESSDLAPSNVVSDCESKLADSDVNEKANGPALSDVKKKKKKLAAGGPSDNLARQREFDERSEISNGSDARSQYSSRSHHSTESARAMKSQARMPTQPTDDRRVARLGDFAAIEEGNENEGSSDDEEGQEWVNPPASSCVWGVFAPVKSLWEILFRDRTIRPALGEDSYCIDCLICIGLMWCLADSITAAFGLRLEGFMTWMDTDGSLFVRMIYCGYNTLASTVLLVAIGYCVPNVVFNTVQVDASKQNRYQMFTTYVKGMIPITLDGFVKSSPVIWCTVIIATIFGALSSKDSVIRAEYYDTCSKSWWTNAAYVTNLFIIGSAAQANATLSYSTEYDPSSQSMELEYADTGVCFPSLWLISCAAQLSLLSLPFVYLYLEYPTAALNGTYLVICLTVLGRMYLAMKVSSPTMYAGLIYYSPWGRADAFCFGLRLFMNAHMKFVSPTENSRTLANRDIGLIQLLLWSCWGLVPKQISHREFRSRRRRLGSASETASVSETSSLLGTKKKAAKKKKRVSKSPRTFDTLDTRTRTEQLEEGRGGQLLDDDIDDSRSIFSQLTSESYKFPSTISYMARAYEEADLSDNYTDVDRSVYSYDSLQDNTPVPVVWLSCINFCQVLYFLVILAGCIYWVVFSFTINSTDGDIRPDWFLFSEWQYRNASIFIVGLGTYVFASLALGGSVTPLSYLMSMDVWHPLASVGLCFYITQSLTANLMCSMLYADLGFIICVC